MRGSVWGGGSNSEREVRLGLGGWMIDGLVRGSGISTGRDRKLGLVNARCISAAFMQPFHFTRYQLNIRSAVRPEEQE